jgi:hypothetical protein
MSAHTISECGTWLRPWQLERFHHAGQRRPASAEPLRCDPAKSGKHPAPGSRRTTAAPTPRRSSVAAGSFSIFFDLWQIGGSYAQRDVVDWTLTEAAVRAGRPDIALSLVATRPRSAPTVAFFALPRTSSADDGKIA